MKVTVKLKDGKCPWIKKRELHFNDAERIWFRDKCVSIGTEHWQAQGCSVFRIDEIEYMDVEE